MTIAIFQPKSDFLTKGGCYWISFDQETLSVKWISHNAEARKY
jgi:hypothetical protein